MPVEGKELGWERMVLGGPGNGSVGRAGPLRPPWRLRASWEPLEGAEFVFLKRFLWLMVGWRSDGTGSRKKS